MKSIKSNDYYIHFNSDSYQELNSYLVNNKPSKIFVLVDSNTNTYCYAIFIEQLETNVEIEVIEIEPGEIHKNIETCAGIWNVLTELGADRSSLLINLGGGVITDMGGFIASTYKRGISFINIPTTLLSMVDASVGGKTGVDLGVLKNQVGVFSYPEMVLIDSQYLQTVSEREMRSGMAEILKYGLTKNIKLWVEIRDNNELNFSDLDDLIYESINIKNTIVLEDPKEKGLRKVLNFGHTLGHAIESYYLENETKNSLTHGEAIAVGMVCAAYISHVLFGFDKEKLTDVKNVLLSIYGKVDIDNSDYNAILELLKHDKKNANGEVLFVLLSDYEKFKLNCKVPENVIKDSLNYYCN